MKHQRRWPVEREGQSSRGQWRGWKRTGGPFSPGEAGVGCLPGGLRALPVVAE